MAKAPIEYATSGPKHQNTDDATIGPNPRARAPRDRKIPRAVPRSFILGTLDVAIEVRVGPQIADPTNKNKIMFFNFKNLKTIHIYIYQSSSKTIQRPKLLCRCKMQVEEKQET
jgi:hypothetical protein